MNEKLVLGTLLSLFLLSTTTGGPSAASAQVVPNQRVCEGGPTVNGQQPVGEACVTTSDGSAPPVLPAGAVVAFNLAACPTGWTTFTAAAGRAIVGVGAGSGLTARLLGQSGGEESHTMTVGELVSHTHAITFNKHFAADGGNGDFGPGTGSSHATDAAGSGAAFNVMDPYYALLYCQKT